MDKVKRVKNRNVLTITKSVLRQFLFFPLAFNILIPFYFIILLSISLGGEFNFRILLASYIAAAFFSALGGFLFGIQFKRHSGFNLTIFIAILFTPLVLNTLTLVFLGIIGDTAALIANIAFNPIFAVITLLTHFGEPMLASGILIIMSAVYPMTFYITTRRAFKTPPLKPGELTELGAVHPRKQLRIASAIMAVIVAVTFCAAVYVQYPDVEYMALKMKYDAIDFTEEIEGNEYYESWLLELQRPFLENNGLIILDKPPSLKFTDIETMPRLDGATAFYPMYASFVQNVYTGLADSLDKVTDIVICSKTDLAYRRLAEGSADMIFAFEPSQDQLQYAAEKGVEYEMTLIGYDAFCFFVNVKNPVNGLALQQVREIYHGSIKNWRGVGGKYARIMAFTRPKNSGSQTIMESEVMKGLPINSIYNALQVRTMGGMIRVIDSYLNTPNAIGYTFMFYSSQMVKGDSIKYLAIDGIAPTEENVRLQKYAFTVPFYAITRKGQETPQTQQLLEFITGEQGRSLIADVGYVSAN